VLSVNDMKVSADAEAPDRNDSELPRPYFAANGVARDERDPEPRHDTFLDGLGMVQLHRLHRRYPGLLERALYHLASGGPRFSDQEPLRRDIPLAGAASPSPVVARRCDEHELVNKARADAPLARTKHVPSDDPQVQLARTDPLFDDARIRDM
jgi:hypothetical protein